MFHSSIHLEPQSIPLDHAPKTTYHNQCAFEQIQCAQIAPFPLPIAAPKYLVIFDWDNTIIPTTEFFDDDCAVRHSVTGDQLQSFAKAAHEMVLKYIDTFGAENVYIVTNGRSKWIMTSLDRLDSKEKALSGTDHWHRFQQLLTSKLSGHMISAQALHGESYPMMTTQWKTLVFQKIAFEHFKVGGVHRKCSIISIGDSNDEFVASMTTKNMLATYCGIDNVHLVRVPLWRYPSADMMLEQFNVLNKVCAAIHIQGHWKSFDLGFEDVVNGQKKILQISK